MAVSKIFLLRQIKQIWSRNILVYQSIYKNDYWYVRNPAFLYATIEGSMRLSKRFKYHLNISPTGENVNGWHMIVLKIIMRHNCGTTCSKYGSRFLFLTFINCKLSISACRVLIRKFMFELHSFCIHCYLLCFAHRVVQENKWISKTLTSTTRTKFWIFFRINQSSQFLYYCYFCFKLNLRLSYFKERIGKICIHFF